MTTKKKAKKTAKEDLIDSLMNDVQELSGQETLHGNASSDLFSNSEYSDSDEFKNPEDSAHDFAAQLVSEVGSDDGEDGDSSSASDLWQQLKDAPATAKEETQAGLVIDVDESSHSEDSLGSLAPPATPSAFAPVSEGEPADDRTINLSEAQLAAVNAIQSQPPEAPAHKATPESRVETRGTHSDNDKTIAVAGFANRQPLASADVTPKVSFGAIRSAMGSSGSVYAASDATLAQSESLRMAQRRILELEKEVEKYRYENDELASAGDIIRERAESLTARVSSLEGEKQEAIESLQNEIMILKGTHQFKEVELNKARLKIEELEGRLKTDFKKIRVRERELENRLELVKAEKSALLRAKDENILDLKRKIDHLQSELDNYRVKVLELNKTIDVNQEQFKRTVRALRLALSNLEVKEESVVPLKKAD